MSIAAAVSTVIFAITAAGKASQSTNQQASNGVNRDGAKEIEHGYRWWGGEHGDDWGIRNLSSNTGGSPTDQAFVWDEENRMIHAWTNGTDTDFLYDYYGERTLKRGIHGEPRGMQRG